MLVDGRDKSPAMTGKVRTVMTPTTASPHAHGRLVRPAFCAESPASPRRLFRLASLAEMLKLVPESAKKRDNSPKSGITL